MKHPVVLIVAVLIIGISAGVYMLAVSDWEARSRDKNSSDVLVGGDRDEHGCIGSAGYSWCEEKGRCLRIWEEPCSGESIPVASDKDSEESLKRSVAFLIAAKHSLAAEEPIVSITKQIGDYASGGVKFGDGQGGGGMWFAAFTGGSWKLVWDGNGTIMCEDVVPYPAFPSSLIPSCYDSASGMMVER